MHEVGEKLRNYQAALETKEKNPVVTK